MKNDCALKRLPEVFHADFQEMWFERLHLNLGAVSDCLERVPCLWRARLDPLLMGVELELMGHVHAKARRISGGRIEIKGVNRCGHLFAFTIEERRLNNTRTFWSKFNCGVGVGALIYPGHYAAFVRYLENSLEEQEEEQDNEI
jgi:hypothetical protein